MNYDNSYTGTIRKNDKKEPGDKRPDYKGQINIDGVPHWLAGWIRKGDDGTTFLSLKAEPKEEQQQKPAPKKSRQDDEEIPF
jgi:uncharacterized protein (DUF736 family)